MTTNKQSTSTRRKFLGGAAVAGGGGNCAIRGLARAGHHHADAEHLAPNDIFHDYAPRLSARSTI